jgi:glycerol uptake facilitator-like aquaporin
MITNNLLISIENAAYLETSLSTSLIADCFGEILGSAILTVGIIFQYDELLDFTNNRLEHSIIIGSLYAFGRTLAYKSQSILNPAVALR